VRACFLRFWADASRALPVEWSERPRRRGGANLAKDADANA
jgi:hypothetical protein